jgi:hypothetical protein
MKTNLRSERNPETRHLKAEQKLIVYYAWTHSHVSVDDHCEKQKIREMRPLTSQAGLEWHLEWHQSPLIHD